MQVIPTRKERISLKMSDNDTNGNTMLKTKDSANLKVVDEDKKLAMRYAVRFFLVSIAFQIVIFLAGWFAAHAIFHVNPLEVNTKQIIFVAGCALIAIISSYRSANKLYREYMSDVDTKEFIV